MAGPGRREGCLGGPPRARSMAEPGQQHSKWHLHCPRAPPGQSPSFPRVLVEEQGGWGPGRGPAFRGSRYEAPEAGWTDKHKNLQLTALPGRLPGGGGGRAGGPGGTDRWGGGEGRKGRDPADPPAGGNPGGPWGTLVSAPTTQLQFPVMKKGRPQPVLPGPWDSRTATVTAVAAAALASPHPTSRAVGLTPHSERP